MSHHPRQILTPGASRKRKEREALYTARPLAPPVMAVTTITSSKVAEPASSNRLLAGYMAYEFLTKGTLFGQKWDPARAGAVPVSNSGHLGDWKRTKPGQSQSSEAEPSGRVKHQQQQQQQQPHPETYAVVSNLLKGDGAHVPGIVNPTQLARWIQM